LLHTPPDPRKTSAAATWAPLARFIDGEARIGQWAQRRKATAFAYELIRFGIKQGWACLFGAAMVALIVGTHLWYPRGAALSRYDFMFVAALGIQAAMLAWKLETWEEAKVILIYHVVGTIMEVFKTGVGSWIYPEPSIFHIAGVPLFSGFMYAAVGSYITRCWRLFDSRLGDLHQFLRASLRRRHAISLVRGGCVAVWAHVDLLQDMARASTHADAAWPWSGLAVHLDRREPWHIHANLALPAPDGRLVGGVARQAWLVVPAADHQLRLGCGGEPPSGC
jgi:Protein of unknown function (DUF817)